MTAPADRPAAARPFVATPAVAAFGAALVAAVQALEPLRNPWLASAGVFADDPALPRMLDAIYAARERARRALDEEIMP